MRRTVLAVFLLTACTTSSDAVSSDAVATNPNLLAPTSAGSGDVAPASGPSAGSTESLTVEPETSTTEASEASGIRPEGFETTRARATAPDGTVCELCVWLADTAQQRSRGLMFVTDLGPADGMAFRYPDPHTGTFWMKNTVLPLSIVFFGPDGGFLSSLDMEPCTTDECPSYRTADSFVIAVEVPRGEPADLGLVEGSTFELLDRPCNPD